jgi:hypothetical protein
MLLASTAYIDSLPTDSVPEKCPVESSKSLVRMERLELSRPCERWNLNPIEAKLRRAD